MMKLSKKRLKIWGLTGISLFVLFLLLVPAPRFPNVYSTVLFDRDGGLLNAQVAADEQWRFEEAAIVPEKFEKAILLFEDRSFYAHPGVNLFSLSRALVQNIRAGRVVAGGSTITMQLARLSSRHRERTVARKSWEILKAVKAEIVYSKRTILRKYAAHAPFGGNVVGLEAACWRYFGVAPDQISWAQAATLAVLPNHPAMIFPGRNQERLLEKRNALLRRMKDAEIIDRFTLDLALQEPVPGPPKPLPQEAAELATQLIRNGQKGRRITTSLDGTLQRQLRQVVGYYHQIYRANQIHNAAAIILDVRSGKTLAYVGNVGDTARGHGSQVDIIRSPRSYGSLLKPVLFAAAIDGGMIGPSSLLPDYPVQFGGFQPKNFHVEFEGLAAANHALIRSLNVPNVFLLKEYGTAAFLNQLQNMGMTTFRKPAAHYGLSLILGGAESSLWELTGVYAAMAHRLATDDTVFTADVVFGNRVSPLGSKFSTTRFSSATLFTTLQELTNLYRPGEDGRWEQFASAEKVAWKTGTSFGNRDGWAIGVTPRYAIGVWVGNASGEGMSDLVGAHFAAPVLFDLFSRLPRGPWFPVPKSGWSSVSVCSKSGFRASEYCAIRKDVSLPSAAKQMPICRFHQRLHLDSSARFQVNSSCYAPSSMVQSTWFVLSPIEELYYRKKHSDYRALPPFLPGCAPSREAVMSLVTPSNHASVYVPKDRGGERGKVVFELAHRDPDAVIYWHSDLGFLGKTKGVHKMELDMPAGHRTFRFVDGMGNALEADCTFLQKEGSGDPGMK